MIKLKELLHKPVPPVLYHATFNALIPSIQKHGLLPNGGENSYINFENIESGVYMAIDPNEAGSFVEVSENPDIPEEWFNEIVVISIDTSKLNPNDFDVDTNVISSDHEDNRPFIYKGIVPPSAFIDIKDY
jgi:hypothetical protein